MSRPADCLFRSAELTVAQDWDQVAGWLARHGRSLDRASPPRQFRGGLANLNYLVSVDGAELVLRRPPPGPVAEGANDMAREWRILRQLTDAYPLAPRGLLYCDDLSVLGAPFLLLEYRPGIGVGARLPGQLAGRPGIAERLTAALVSSMAWLHAVDPAAAGLAELGRPEGFLRRQVEGWARRADAAYLGQPPPEVTAILAWLRRRVPPDPASASLLHCDLKPDNILVDPATVIPVAVVDWDMATRGDPLFDLAVVLSYWVDASDPAELHGLGQVPSLEPGFPRRRDVADGYFAAAGRDGDDFSFHLTLARLRLGIAWQQLFRLHERGALPDPRYAAFAGTARAVLAWTADTLHDPPL